MARRKSSSRSQEHFARLPLSVLESEAVTTLNHAAFKVLAVLAVQYRGSNNGTLALTESYARRFGLKGRDTLYRSLRELERRGLIVRTRQGMKSKKLFSLFAIGWEAITHRDGRPLDVPEPRNHRWLKWKAAAEIHTDGRESCVPTIGSDTPVSVPMVTDRLPISVPTIGNTSRFWPGASSASPPDPAPDSALVPLQAAGGRIRKLHVRVSRKTKQLPNVKASA